MDRRHWNILCWNIRGVNYQVKWDAIRQKIDESACSIVCLQETKRAVFDSAYIRNFAPHHFDKFEFFPLVGYSGGLLVLWNSAVFSGQVLESRLILLQLWMIVFGVSLWFMVPVLSLYVLNLFNG